jgi:SH3 domain-containing YSC84-like protein 1
MIASRRRIRCCTNSLDTPDKGIPTNIAAKATCVAVVPGFKKGAFIVGGQYGQGIVSCRTGHGWSAPAFIQMTGASFGFQAGGQSTDLVLIAMTHDGFQRLLADKVKLGGDASVAAGPVGRNANANTTELANAAFLSYSRNKGIFAGIDLTGDVVNQNQGDTDLYYGKHLKYEQILNGRIPPPPSYSTQINVKTRAKRRNKNNDSSFPVPQAFDTNSKASLS